MKKNNHFDIRWKSFNRQIEICQSEYETLIDRIRTQCGKTSTLNYYATKRMFELNSLDWSRDKLINNHYRRKDLKKLRNNNKLFKFTYNEISSLNSISRVNYDEYKYSIDASSKFEYCIRAKTNYNVTYYTISKLDNTNVKIKELIMQDDSNDYDVDNYTFKNLDEFIWHMIGY